MRMFPKKPIVFEIYVEFGAFWGQIFRGSKNFGLMAGKFGKFGLKALFALYLALSLSVSQKRWTMKSRMKISVDVAVTINHAVFIEEINK